MDSIQTMAGVETPAGESAPVPAEQELEAQAVEQTGTAEMSGLPVEDWDYQRPRRGEVRDGVILAVREQEIIVDVGVKRDGIVPYADMQRMGDEALAELSVGDEVPVYILRPEDQDGNLLVSLFLARQAQAWKRAQELADTGEVWEEEVIGYNKGGLVVPVGEIRGFVPASQVPGFPMGLNQEERLSRLAQRVGEKLQVKVIEINRRKRRLILSATAAQVLWRKKQRKRLLEELREGEVREGVVSSLCSFGAFVDLGGADGLVHLSELSWRRIHHPKEVLNVGDRVEVYVLRLDHEKKRIGLSLKRLQPEPWALIEDKYELGQLVEGVVTNVVDFGAFAEIDEGVEGLIHVSELADAPISHPKEVVKKGDLLLLRIIRIDARRKRLGLSLKRVLESEWAEWAARLAIDDAREEPAEGPAEELEAMEPEEPVGEVEEMPAAEALVSEEADQPAEEPEAMEPEEPVGEVEEMPAPEALVSEEADEPADELEAMEPEEPVGEVEEVPAPEALVTEAAEGPAEGPADELEAMEPEEPVGEIEEVPAAEALVAEEAEGPADEPADEPEALDLEEIEIPAAEEAEPVAAEA